MKNENGHSFTADRMVDQHSLLSVGECAEEIDFRSRAFLRSYANPAVNIDSVVLRARALRDLVREFDSLLTTLITSHETL